MKGLILKDLYMAKKYFRSFLLLIVLFLGMALVDQGNLFFVFYPCLLSGMIPVTLLAYDEQAKWDVYAGTLPVTRAQVVSAKYLIGLIAQFAVILLVALTQGIRNAFTHWLPWGEYLDMMYMLVFISGFASSITLPFMFKLGVEKGRMAYYVMIGVVAGGSAMLSGIFAEQGGAMQLPTLLPPVMALAGVGILALSWRLSIRFYEKRDLN